LLLRKCKLLYALPAEEDEQLVDRGGVVLEAPVNKALEVPIPTTVNGGWLAWRLSARPR